MAAAQTLLVALLADGRLQVLSGVPGAPDADARWQRLGWVWQDGRRMVFVRAEIAGASWGSLVRNERLGPRAGSARVTLTRQTAPPCEALSGWSLFC